MLAIAEQMILFFLKNVVKTEENPEKSAEKWLCKNAANGN